MRKILNLIINNIPILLISTLILGIFFSIFIANFMSFILSLYVVCHIFCKVEVRQQYKNYIMQHRLLIIAICSWVYCLIGATFVTQTFIASIAWLRFPLSAIAIGLLIDNNTKTTNRLQTFMHYFGIFIITNLFMQLIIGYDIFGHRYIGDDTSTRLTAITGKPDIGIALLTVMLPIYSLYVNKIITAKEIFKKVLYISLLIAHLLAIFFTEQRIAMVYSLFAIFVILCFQFYNARSTKWNIFKICNILIAILISIALGILILYKNDLSIRNRINFSIMQMEDFSNTAYGMIYKTSYTMWKNNPIFGVGKGNYRKYCTQYMDSNLSEFLQQHGCGLHSHNIYLQFLSELGVVGFVALFFTLLSVIQFCIKNCKIAFHDPFCIGAITSFVVVFIPFVTSSAFDVRAMMPAWISFGIAISACKQKK